MKQNMTQTCKHCETKKAVVLEVNKTGAWMFRQAEGEKGDGGDLYTVAVELDSAGRFIEVWNNGERFPMDAAEVAELAATCIPKPVWDAIIAYGDMLNVPVRKLNSEQFKRANAYEATRKRKTA